MSEIGRVQVTDVLDGVTKYRGVIMNSAKEIPVDLTVDLTAGLDMFNIFRYSESDDSQLLITFDATATRIFADFTTNRSQKESRHKIYSIIACLDQNPSNNRHGVSKLLMAIYHDNLICTVWQLFAIWRWAWEVALEPLIKIRFWGIRVDVASDTMKQRAKYIVPSWEMVFN